MANEWFLRLDQFLNNFSKSHLPSCHDFLLIILRKLSELLWQAGILFVLGPFLVGVRFLFVWNYPLRPYPDLELITIALVLAKDAVFGFSINGEDLLLQLAAQCVGLYMVDSFLRARAALIVLNEAMQVRQHMLQAQLACLPYQGVIACAILLPSQLLVSTLFDLVVLIHASEANSFVKEFVEVEVVLYQEL